MARILGSTPTASRGLANMDSPMRRCPFSKNNKEERKENIMDPFARKQLEEHLCAEVQKLLATADQHYIQGLSPTAFLEAVENEVRFLGLYPHADTETPEVIHAILEQTLAQWLEYYGGSDKETVNSGTPVGKPGRG
jgi:hypothetical protein